MEGNSYGVELDEASMMNVPALRLACNCVACELLLFISHIIYSHMSYICTYVRMYVRMSFYAGS